MSSLDSSTQPSSVPGIEYTVDTISASIPFDYTLSTDNNTMADTESTSSDTGSSIYNSTSSQSLDEVTMSYFGSPDSKNDRDFNSFDSIPLQNMNSATGDNDLREKEAGSDSDQEDIVCTSQDVHHNVRLQLVSNDNKLTHHAKSSSMSELSIEMEQSEDTQTFPPQVHIRLYRNKDNGSKRTDRQDILSKYIGSGNRNNDTMEQSASLPDLKNNKYRPRKPNLSKLKSRFQRSKSVPVLNVVPEEKENQNVCPGSPTDSSCDSMDNGNQSSPRPSTVSPTRRRMFMRNKRTNPTHHSAIIAQHRKKVSFQSLNNANEIANDNDNDNVTVGKKRNECDTSDDISNSNSENVDPSNTISKHFSTESALDATIKISKKSHFRGGQFCTLLRKFTTVLPPDEIAQMTVVIKDATDVFPLDNGGAIVSDILSNKMVLFDELGFPKVTFAMENGSDPWSAVVTPDNGSIAATLKGEGCVCLWSPKGESQTDFGHGILSSPTGIHFDHRGRFVVSDEEKNAIYLFSRTGNFIREFINQDSLNPFAGNKAMETLNQPRYLCVSRDGLYFVSDSSNQIVKIFDEEGNILKTIGSYGRDDGQFRFPYGVAFDEDTKLLYVADHFNHRVSVFSLNGTFLYHILTQADGITRPKGLAIRGSKLIVTFGDMRAGHVSMYRIHANGDGGS